MNKPIHVELTLSAQKLMMREVAVAKMAMKMTHQTMTASTVTCADEWTHATITTAVHKQIQHV